MTWYFSYKPGIQICGCALVVKQSIVSKERDTNMEGLAFAGKVIQLDPIEEADRIALATVVCGQGGRWRGVVPKDIDQDHVIVVLPDSILPADDPKYGFMGQYKWRVRQRTFKGVPSECLILQDDTQGIHTIGDDLSEELKLVKYEKASGLTVAQAEGMRPSFIPKTDEPLLQSVMWMLDALYGKPFLITLKMDGSSTTVFRHESTFGLCSRTMLLKPGDTAFHRAARRYHLEERLPEGMAIQFETCGPGIQKNKAGLQEVVRECAEGAT